jgi:aarF domain-containing kinase
MFFHLPKFKYLHKLNRYFIAEIPTIIACSLEFQKPSYCDESSLVKIDSTPLVKIAKLDTKGLYKYFWNKLVTSYSSFCTILRVLLRSIYLSLLFSAPILFSPLLFFNKTYSENWWEMLKNSIRLSGPCLTKFAQWIATRPDLFPIDLCKHLQDLQSSHSFSSYTIDHLIRHLNSEFEHKPIRWNQRFQLLSETDEHGNKTLLNIGSGCIAQVVRAFDVVNNQSVVFKVVHPNIKSAIEADISLMRAFASLFNLIPGWNVFSLPESIDVFSDLMTQQMDMKREANNLIKFRSNFKIDQDLVENVDANTTFVEKIMKIANDFIQKNLLPGSSSQYVTFPKPQPDWCTSNVLVEEFIEGTLISEMMIGPLQNDPIIRKKLAMLGLDAILKMIFEDNFVHAGLSLQLYEMSNRYISVRAFLFWFLLNFT